MQKYLAIINNKTAFILLLCLVITWLCFEFNFNYNLNITLFSIAVIFPLVFTIRESFRRRDNLIKLLSIFKTSLSSIYYCFDDNLKLSDNTKQEVAEKLQEISSLFLSSLSGQNYDSAAVNIKMTGIYHLIQQHRESISSSTSQKIIRFLKDVHESMENAMGLKMHGTPISLRAYCLVFIYVFPVIFVPTLVFDMHENPHWIVYLLSCLHGFILISLFNVQDDMEDPFDQIGLDDIKMDTFEFRRAPELQKAAFADAIEPKVQELPEKLAGQ